MCERETIFLQRRIAELTETNALLNQRILTEMRQNHYLRLDIGRLTELTERYPLELFVHDEEPNAEYDDDELGPMEDENDQVR